MNKPLLMIIVVSAISKSVYANMAPSQAGYGTQWWLNNPSIPQKTIELSLLKSNESLGVDLARAEGLDGNGVKVAVLDTGINDLAKFGGIVESAFGTGIPRDRHGDLVGTVLADQNEGVASRAVLIDARHNKQASFINSSMVEASKQADIISFSGGYIYSEAIDTPENRVKVAPIVKTLEKVILEEGALVIQSAANDSLKNPKLDALAMAVNPELTKGWISVVGYNSQSDRTLTSWSNACGMAADYCMAAPGYFSSPTATGSHIYYGTSFATPRVSGTAALLKQKYPWASNDVLRTILLTTADDLGDKSKYGWGALNVASAIKGMKQLPFGELETNVTEGVYSFSNDISGAGSLKKTGIGTLNLDGINTFKGGIAVSEGVLNINQSYDGSVFVDKTGELGGSGSVNNVQIHSGFINFLDGLKVQNLELTDSATTKLAPGQDILIIQNAKFGGKLDILKLDEVIKESAPQEIQTSIRVNGLYSGIFNQVNTPLMYSSAVHYLPNSINIVVARSSSEDLEKKLNMGKNEQNVIHQGIRNLDAVAEKNVVNNNPELTKRLSGIYTTYDANALKKSLYSLGGSIYQNSLNKAILQISNSLIDSNQSAVEMISQNEEFLYSPQIFARTNFANNTIKPEDGLQAKNNGFQAVLGVAFPIERGSIGLTFMKGKLNWQESFDQHFMGSSDVYSNGIGLNLATRLGPVVIGGYLSGYNLKNSVNRRIDTVLEDSMVYSKQNTRLYQAGASIDGIYKTKRAKFGINIGGQFDWINKDGINEVGNNALAIRANDSNDTLKMLYASSRVEIPLKHSFIHSLQGKVGLQYDVKQRNLFNQGWDIPKLRGNIEAGANFELVENVFATLGVKYDYADNYNDTSGLLGINAKF